MGESPKLVAVLIAELVADQFAPITIDKPQALIPLVNKPMIDYALEWLTMSKVDKVYIYAVHCSDKIKAYLQQSLWMRENSRMVIEVFSQRPDQCISLGDCLRDIHGKGLIRGDFILLSAGVVANVNIHPLIQRHKEKRKADKGMLMTHLFRKCSPNHLSCSAKEELVLVVDPATEKILHFHQCSSHDLEEIAFPLSIFQANKSAQIRHDFFDTQIFICSSDVLTLFADNFYHETMADFIDLVLSNTDSPKSSICYQLLEGEYAAEVSNIFSYDAISKDILRRLPTPLPSGVPDTEWGGQVLSRHVPSRHNVYVQPDVTLAKGSVLESSVAVGKGTFICEGTHVEQSVIGRNCLIGTDTRVSNTYIWDNVIIKDKCIISGAIIANDVTLNEGVEVGCGCVIGQGVILAAGTMIPPNIRLMAHPPKSDSSFESSDNEKDDVTIKPAYPECQAFIYDTLKSKSDKLGGLAIEVEVDENEDDGMFEDDLCLQFFKSEMDDSMKRAYKDKIDSDNLLMEISCSRLAYNISIGDVNELVMEAILSFPNCLSKDANNFDKHSYWNALKPVLQYFLPLLLKYGQADVSQLKYLWTLDQYGVSNGFCGGVSSSILSVMYDADVLSEENIRKWHETPPTDPLAENSVRKHALKFIEWLAQAEEED